MLCIEPSMSLAGGDEYNRIIQVLYLSKDRIVRYTSGGNPEEITSFNDSNISKYLKLGYNATSSYDEAVRLRLVTISPYFRSMIINHLGSCWNLKTHLSGWGIKDFEKYGIDDGYHYYGVLVVVGTATGQPRVIYDFYREQNTEETGSINVKLKFKKVDQNGNQIDNAIFRIGPATGIGENVATLKIDGVNRANASFTIGEKEIELITNLAYPDKDYFCMNLEEITAPNGYEGVKPVRLKISFDSNKNTVTNVEFEGDRKR